MNTNPNITRRIRPMTTEASGYQHLAEPVTLDGTAWSWVSLCGRQMDVAATIRRLDRHHEHIAKPDCVKCAHIVGIVPLHPNLRALAENLRY